MEENEEQAISDQIGKQLHTNRLLKIGEILLVFIPAFAFIRLMNPLVGENLILKQAVVWIANILMLIIVWVGLKLRGESWNNFGDRKSTRLNSSHYS